MPHPREGERQSKFISRCMASRESKNKFPNQQQRVAFCHSQWRDGTMSSAEYKKHHYFLTQRAQDLIEASKMPDHILNKVSESYADDKAGYPPNCNEGHVVKDGKCVPEDK